MNCGSHHNHEEGGCDHIHAATPVTQSLDELEFQRGLWQAAVNGDFERAQLLINRGSDVNRIDESGYSPLHYACRTGNLSICKLFVSKGADVNAVVRIYWYHSKLSDKVSCNSSSPSGDVAAFLLEKGAFHSPQDDDGATPLHKAASQGKVETVEVLLRFGASKTLCDKAGKTPHDVASESCKPLLALHKT